MKKLTFLEKMDIPDFEFRKDEKIEKESVEMEKKSKEETQKEFPKLDEEIWQAGQEFRKGQDIDAEDLYDHYTKFTSLRRKKMAIKDVCRSAIEEKRRQRENLVKGYREEAVTTLDLERQKIMNKYVCEMPPFAVGPTGKELDHRGYRKNLESNILYMLIRTNADAIVRGQELLTLYRGRIMTASSLRNLKETFEALQREYDGIDFESKEIEVVENFFERLDKTNPLDVAIQLSSGEIRILNTRPQESSQDLFKKTF